MNDAAKLTLPPKTLETKDPRAKAVLETAKAKYPKAVIKKMQAIYGNVQQ